MPQRGASTNEREDLAARLGEAPPRRPHAVEETIVVPLSAQQAPAPMPASRVRTGERKALASLEPPERKLGKEAQTPEDADAHPTARFSLSGVLPQAAKTPRIPPDERTVMVRLSAAGPSAPVPVDEVITARGIPVPVDEVITARGIPVPVDEVITARGIPVPVDEVITARGIPVPVDEVVTARGMPALPDEAVAPRPSPAPRAKEAAAPPVISPKRTSMARRQPAARPGSSPNVGTGSRKAGPAEGSTLPPLAPLTEQEEASSFRLPDMNSLQEGMKLGGYQLLRKIGAGSMGTVWLARQLSLDRDVALKVLRPSLSGDPQFVYRFTQEAFAAAQLVHHHIVQIYDCGSEKKVHFFSMEYVDAESLLSLVNREGRLDPEVAAGYVLQAARGLKFAHDRGMVHRDIKPDNLLINHNGIVKVADLGMVKRARRVQPLPDNDDAVTEEQSSSELGRNPQEFAMGTPAYMSPEQVENASRVDARSDIYSLGCTLYHLLTGRPPFMSESVPALMGMHVLEPPVPPEERVRRVPKGLSDLVLRMLAKAPEERLQTMGEVIKTLEAFLGIEGTAAFSPREEHANLLERCVQGFNRAPWGRRRRRLAQGFGAMSAVGAGIAGVRFGPLLALGVLAFAASTWMASFIVRGLFQKGTLFLRFRQFIFQAPLLTWLLWLLMLGVAGYGLYHFQLAAQAGVMLAGALVCALVFYGLVDRQVEAERKPFVDEVERMLRSMRLRGLEEGSLRQFVCKYSGETWEAFYEALFGYDATLLARERWGRNERGLIREKHSAWREPLIRGMDAVEHARQHRREQRQLRMLERKRTKAQQRPTAATSA